MKFDVITLFPKLIEDYLSYGVMSRAVKDGKIQVQTWDPREQTGDNHRTVDDRPFGGGDGMVMLPEVLKSTLSKISQGNQKKRVVYLSAQGSKLDFAKSRKLAQDYEQIVLICGRYGGIDQRIIDKYVDEEISIGDYILSGGELPAMVTMESISRFLPGVLGNEASSQFDSFEEGLLEHSLYTRPREFEGVSVPEVLFSGHHEKIEKFRRDEMLKKTAQRRPDLLIKSGVDLKAVKQAMGNSINQQQNLAIGLIHYPVFNKMGEVVATNVTNLDIHDMARACKSYGVEKFYIITPAEEQLAFVGRVLDHWQKGRGVGFNPMRGESLTMARVARSFEEALEDWGVSDTQVVATSARTVAGPTKIGYSELSSLIVKKPVLLLFGTGYGIENSLIRRCNFLLEGIKGRSPDGFNHLSVRSAVSITLDRLMGSCY